MKCPHCQGLGRQPQGTSLAKYLQFQSAVCSCGQQMFFTNKAHFEWHLVLCLNVLGSICLTFGRLKPQPLIRSVLPHLHQLMATFFVAGKVQVNGRGATLRRKIQPMLLLKKRDRRRLDSKCSKAPGGSLAKPIASQAHRQRIPSDILWWWLPCAEPPVAPLARDLYWWGGHSTSAAGQVPALLWARRRGLVFGWMRPSRICRTKLNRRTPTRMGWRFTTWLQCSECARILSCY